MGKVDIEGCGKLSTSNEKCTVHLDRFVDLYKKFVKGKKWLDGQEGKGIDIKADNKDFLDKVVFPVNDAYNCLNNVEIEAADVIVKVSEKMGCKNILKKA